MGGSNELRAQVMLDTAEDVLARGLKRGQEEGILEPVDVAIMLFVAVSIPIVRMQETNKRVASHVATYCLGSFLETVVANRIELGQSSIRGQ